MRLSFVGPYAAKPVTRHEDAWGGGQRSRSIDSRSRARTHRSDLEPGRIVGVQTQHVVTRLTSLHGAAATPGVPASDAAGCRAKEPRVVGGELR